MSKRITLNPKAYQAIMGLEHYMENSTVKKAHYELIKIRVSQINHCAYCINMHTKDARAGGETEQRIYLLNAWRETSFYTPEERAILALVEEITAISEHGVSDAIYEEAERVLGKEYLHDVYMAAVSINAWNRIGVGLQMQPA